MKNLPKISIVTPSYKSAKTIEATIKSIIDQGYPNLEYIIIDGGDEDTVTILKKYENQIAYWVSEKDEGQYDAIIKGFNYATGEIFAWLNADDMLLPRSLFIVAEIFMKFQEINWISSLQPGSWDANGSLAHIGQTPGFSKKAFLDGVYLPGTTVRGYWIQQESTFFRKEIYLKSSASLRKKSLAGDFSLWCEFYKYTELVGVNYPIAGFRHIGGQRSLAIEEYMEESKEVLNELRIHCHYKCRPFKTNLWLRFARVFKKIKPLRSYFSYQSIKIVNSDLRSTPANWELTVDHFTP